VQAVGAFVPASSPQPLADDEIHLWFFPQWETTRDAVESPALRALLASYLDRPAADLRFARCDRGKPHLTGGELEFNVSHSAGALLLALSRNVELGVDLEAAARRTRSVPELARRWFAPSEADALAALPSAQQHTAFLRLWTCKEAVLKCLGHGISFGLHRVAMELSAHAEVSGLRTDIDTGGVPLQLAILAPDAAHVGALAWRGKRVPVNAFAKQPIAGAAQSG
jgi:4'-phosphopantetheinyl transferase